MGGGGQGALFFMLFFLPLFSLSLTFERRLERLAKLSKLQLLDGPEHVIHADGLPPAVAAYLVGGGCQIVDEDLGRFAESQESLLLNVAVRCLAALVRAQIVHELRQLGLYESLDVRARQLISVRHDNPLCVRVSVCVSTCCCV